ncbi:flagellar hook-length control protein FliK [Nitrincola tapanii]|uniref:Flagellar hook-length control protein-like C-terminal domain-containing protein n=1 Tax=Nitrincola tapanii TaxID=1708751 RepID=A0A5A9W2I3_9GAMM|nr:flagellar hook-length control protein FliK [Nitrincola tapanii]KAA0874763.1 hypothetical protein E1H14_08070 [Nitrincola tapanii]
MLNELNVQSVRLANTQASSSAQELNRLLPAGRETSGWVRSVSENSAQGGGFRIQVEVSGRMIELVSNRPLPEGSQLQLSRDASGSVRASLNALPGGAQPTATSTSPAAARANAEGFLLRIAGNIPALLNNLPSNNALPGLLVTPQAAQALNAQALQNPALMNSGAQNSTSQNAATLNLTTRNLAASNLSTGNPGTSNTNTPQTLTPGTQGTATSIPSGQTTAAMSGTPLNTNAQGGNTPPVDGRGQVSSPISPSAANASPPATSASNTSNPSSPAQPAAPSSNANPASGSAQPSTHSEQARNTQTVAESLRATPASTSTASTSAESSVRAPLPSGASSSSASQIAASVATPLASASASTPAPTEASALSRNTTITQTTTQTTAHSATNPATQSASIRAETTQLTPPPPAALSALTPNARPQGFPIHVLVNGQVIEFISPRPLQAGQQVQISRSETGQFQLSITPPAPPLTQAYQAQVAMQQALRELLPIQIPLADGLNQLQQLSSRADSLRNSALNQMVESMLRLFSVKPGSQEAPAAIARNLQQGGLLSEARLLQNPGKLDKPDLKQQLGQLLKIGDQLPSVAREELNQLVRALLARSTAAQISSLQRWRDLPDGGQERHYRLDLPIQQGNHLENAELRITEERHRDEQGQSVTLWHVRLHFELEEQGSLDAEVSLKAEWELTARFWAEQAPTLALIRERLQSFGQELTDKGFKIELMHAHLGKRQQPDLLPLNKRLVDLHT